MSRGGARYAGETGHRILEKQQRGFVSAHAVLILPEPSAFQKLIRLLPEADVSPVGGEVARVNFFAVRFGSEGGDAVGDDAVLRRRGSGGQRCLHGTRNRRPGRPEIGDRLVFDPAAERRITRHMTQPIAAQTRNIDDADSIHIHSDFLNSDTFIANIAISLIRSPIGKICT